MSKLKAFTDNNINISKKLNSVFFCKEENIVEKGENAGYQHFLLFSQCFQPQDGYKLGSCGKYLKA